MRRRDAIGLFVGALAAPLAGRAQAQSPAKIGFLHPRTVAPDSPTVREIRPVWEKLGYVEPKTVLLRSAENDPARLPALAAELVRLGAGVLIAVGPAAVLAAGSTGAPVVALDLETDPVRRGLAASFARPGGQVTGLFLDQPSLAAKWLELLKEAAPSIQQVALIWDPNTTLDQRDAALAAAAARGLTAHVLEMSAPEGYEARFRQLADAPLTGVILLGSPGLSVGASRFAEAALRHKLPTMTHQSFLAAAGALMSYGPARGGYWTRVVILADRILKGATPGDLPIERPSRFDLVVNQKTARAIGLTLPDSLLLQADEVIE